MDRQMLDPDPVMINRALRLFHSQDAPIALRALGVSSTQRTSSGVFTDFDSATAAAAELSKQARGVYFTLNRCRPALARSARNRFIPGGSSICNADIQRRSWILIDIDPVRLGSVSTTSAEKLSARRLACDVQIFLADHGFREPVIADSGNGRHLLYRVDLEPECELVRDLLRGLAAKYSASHPFAHIDTQVFDPARIVRLYGTVARKGRSTPERPHRLSRLVDVPSHVEVTLPEVIESTIADLGVEQGVSGGPTVSDADTLCVRIRRYLRAIPGATAGRSGDKETFAVACRLVLGFDLTPTEAMPFFREWNESCDPPWSETELEHKLKRAELRGGERGQLLESGKSHGVLPPLPGRRFPVSVPDFVRADSEVFLRQLTRAEIFPGTGREDTWAPALLAARTLSCLHGWHRQIADVVLRDIRHGANAPSNWRRLLPSGFFEHSVCSPLCPRLGGERHKHHADCKRSLADALGCVVEGLDRTGRIDLDTVRTDQPYEEIPDPDGFARTILIDRVPESVSGKYRGRLFPMYLPLAVFGHHSLRARERRMLHGIIREKTHTRHNTKFKRRTDFVVQKGMVFAASGGKTKCPLLDRNQQYAVFGTTPKIIGEAEATG